MGRFTRKQFFQRVQKGKEREEHQKRRTGGSVKVVVVRYGKRETNGGCSEKGGGEGMKGGGENETGRNGSYMGESN